MEIKSQPYFNLKFIYKFLWAIHMTLLYNFFIFLWTDTIFKALYLFVSFYCCSMTIQFYLCFSRCLFLSYQFSSVQSLSHVDSLQARGLQHARLPCPSPTPGAYSNSCTLSRWGHPTISSSAIPFSSCLQSFPASGSFPLSQLFTSGGQRIAVSASASVLPMNIQDWSPWGETGCISLQSKGLSRIFSNTTVQKHQFFSGQLSL